MKIIIGKIGLDGHDVGIRLIARALRDEGAEVIYLGKRKTPEDFAIAAEQEDAHAIGVGSLTGGLLELTLELIDILKQRHMEEVRIVAGGILEAEEENALRAAGVLFFGPETKVEDVVEALLSAAT